MRVPQKALNTAGPDSDAASAEPEAAKAVLAPLQPLKPRDRHPIRMIVVLQKSRDIFESGKGLRVMEIPLSAVESGAFWLVPDAGGHSFMVGSFSAEQEGVKGWWHPSSILGTIARVQACLGRVRAY